MNAQMINTNDELTLDQLDDVNGGDGGMTFFGILAAGALLGGIYYLTKEPTEQGTTDLNNALGGNGVMANEDGSDCTGGRPV